MESPQKIRDRRWTLKEAANLLADHVHAFGGDIESLIEDLTTQANDHLAEMRADAAFETAMDMKADREGMRY